ncbi:CGNR zinc finger domain-containing protein [Nonomuraea solani]|nr:ABATE domain-containing protein [Nonomuraea solani]
MDLLMGEPLALDLVNTRSGSGFDALDGADDFQAWLTGQSHRLTVPEEPLKPSDLSALRALRAHVEATLAAIREAAPPPPEALKALNKALRGAPPYPYLEARGAVLTTGTRRAGPPVTVLLTELAEAAMALLTDPNVGKIRSCEAPDCRMLFLPAHPRRRWCSPDLCGNRVRVARYYQRHKPT